MLLSIWLMCQATHIIAAGLMLLAIIFGYERAWRLAVSYDQLANTALGGSEDETISSRAAKARRSGRIWGCVLCRLLDAIQPGHCDSSIEPDEGAGLT